MIRIPIAYKEKTMGAGPIEDQTIKAAREKADETLRVPPDVPLNEYFGTQPTSSPVSGLTPVEEYIKAQHLFIESQNDYIHNQNVGRLAAEQESYIRAQTKYIAFLLGKK